MRWSSPSASAPASSPPPSSGASRRERDVEAATASMLTLNRGACEAMLHFDVHGCTDVTGFGLHRPRARNGDRQQRDASKSSRRSALPARRARIRARGRRARRPEEQSRIRLLRGRGHARTRAAKSKTCSTIRKPPGGLLISLPEADAARLEQSLPDAYRIGRVLAARRQADPIGIMPKA